MSTSLFTFSSTPSSVQRLYQKFVQKFGTNIISLHHVKDPGYECPTGAEMYQVEYKNLTDRRVRLFFWTTRSE